MRKVGKKAGVEPRKSNSEKVRQQSRSQNRIPKSVWSENRVTRLEHLSASPKGSRKGNFSALDRLAATAACYIHSIPSAAQDTELLYSTGGTRAGGTALYRKTKTREDAVSRCKLGNKEWRKQVLRYARPLSDKLNKRDRREVQALMGFRAYQGPIRASDFRAFRKFGLIYSRVVDDYWRASPGTRWFHITLFDDFLVSDRAPELALKRLKGKVYKEIQKLGLSGLACIDVDPLPNFPQRGKGGSFLFHAHVLAFTREAFDIEKARAKLKKSRAWSSSLQARPTHIREITKKGSPAWWAAYDAKPPYKAKRAVLKASGKVKLRWTKEGYRPQVAFRLFEGMAQLALMDTFFAIGEAKHLREKVRKRLSNWHSKRWHDEPKVDVVAKGVFARAWSQTRVGQCEPWTILGSSL